MSILPFHMEVLDKRGFLSMYWGRCKVRILRKYGSKLRISEPRPTFTGSYEKSVEPH